MKEATVSLRLDVKKDDAKKIIKWLSNEDVTKFLNEDENAIQSLSNVISNNNADLLTYYLNQDGRFFLIDNEFTPCVGFINLFTIRKNKEYEIVVAIGDPKDWGNKYAHNAIKSLLREVFFNWRIEKINAKIHYENERSLHLFENLNFSYENNAGPYKKYTITFNDFISHH